MFDMRLGLVLGKTVGEIYALPYAEYKDWWLLYILEPWGWLNEEINTARILTAIHNSNVSKKSNLKEPSDFIQDRVTAVLASLKSREPIVRDENQTNEEYREVLVRRIKRDLGVEL